ncbi:hypothetical protein LXL04_020459 [Taraxacum kok-saghyz]
MYLHLLDVDTYRSTLLVFALDQCPDNLKPFLPCMLLKHFFEMLVDLEGPHVLERLLKVGRHGPEHDANNLVRFRIQTIVCFDGFVSSIRVKFGQIDIDNFLLVLVPQGTISVKVVTTGQFLPVEHTHNGYPRDAPETGVCLCSQNIRETSILASMNEIRKAPESIKIVDKNVKAHTRAMDLLWGILVGSGWRLPWRFRGMVEGDVNLRRMMLECRGTEVWRDVDSEPRLTNEPMALISLLGYNAINKANHGSGSTF